MLGAYHTRMPTLTKGSVATRTPLMLGSRRGGCVCWGLATRARQTDCKYTQILSRPAQHISGVQAELGGARGGRDVGDAELARRKMEAEASGRALQANGEQASGVRHGRCRRAGLDAIAHMFLQCREDAFGGLPALCRGRSCRSVRCIRCATAAPWVCIAPVVDSHRAGASCCREERAPHHGIASCGCPAAPAELGFPTASRWWCKNMWKDRWVGVATRCQCLWPVTRAVVPARHVTSCRRLDCINDCP